MISNVGFTSVNLFDAQTLFVELSDGRTMSRRVTGYRRSVAHYLPQEPRKGLINMAESGGFEPPIELLVL